MTPEERANNTVKDVANVIGGFANTAARDIIAAVIRDAVAAERGRFGTLAMELYQRDLGDDPRVAVYRSGWNDALLAHARRFREHAEAAGVAVEPDAVREGQP